VDNKSVKSLVGKNGEMWREMGEMDALRTQHLTQKIFTKHEIIKNYKRQGKINAYNRITDILSPQKWGV